MLRNLGFNGASILLRRLHRDGPAAGAARVGPTLNRPAAAEANPEGPPEVIGRRVDSGCGRHLDSKPGDLAQRPFVPVVTRARFQSRTVAAPRLGDPAYRRLSAARPALWGPHREL
jgi:hypothetical protein